MTANILYGALYFALCCSTVSMLCALYRLLKGASPPDRVMALDVLGILVVQSALLLGIMYLTETYFNIALLLAMFSFASSAAMAKFLLRGEVIEP